MGDKMKYYTNLLVLSLFCAFGYNAEWYTVEGKQWKTNFVEICTEEAMVDMGAEFYEYATELKDYCTCMAEVITKVYPTTDEADWAAEQANEDFLSQIIKNGGESCLSTLMTSVMNVEFDKNSELNSASESDAWKTADGKKWKASSIQDCINEAKTDMGAEFYEYATELKDYCTCMMDTAAKAYASPQEAEWAVIQNQEEYYATILQYGGEDCLNILMKMLLEIEGE